MATDARDGSVDMSDFFLHEAQAQLQLALFGAQEGWMEENNAKIREAFAGFSDPKVGNRQRGREGEAARDGDREREAAREAARKIEIEREVETAVVITRPLSPSSPRLSRVSLFSPSSPPLLSLPPPLFPSLLSSSRSFVWNCSHRTIRGTSTMRGRVKC